MPRIRKPLFTTTPHSSSSIEIDKSDGQSDFLGSETSWLSASILEVIHEGLVLLRAHIENKDLEDISWERPWIEAQFDVPWDWKEDSKNRSHKGKTPGRGLAVFDYLTQDVALYRPDNTEYLSFLDEADRSQAVVPIGEGGERDPDSLAAPFSIGRHTSWLDVESENDSDAFTRAELRSLTEKLSEALVFNPELESNIGPVQIIAEFFPIVVVEEEKRAFYPLVIGMEPKAGAASPDGQLIGLANLTHNEKMRFWDLLFMKVQENIKQLKENAAESGVARIERQQSSVTAKPDKVVPPQRRVSVMSPVPMPRALARDAAGIALIRGLGRMFGGYREIPDLDIGGRDATEHASKLFWTQLFDRLDSEGIEYKEESAQKRKTIILYNVKEEAARAFWEGFTKSLNKGENGPGLQVATPEFKTLNAYDHQSRDVKVATGLLLWPAEALDGTQCPVRFRNEGSPGYLELLSEHGPKPFFADGWLWIPRGKEREGFRIGGLSTLLFPEGRVALEQLRKRELQNYESRLQQIFQEPSLFKDEDERAITELQVAIRRVKSWLAGLTTYDCMDLVLCIFEAFHRQRNDWIQEQVLLRDGRKIKTSPTRMIRLDPEELRSRLDPGLKWGQNWRAVLFEKLEALTTFERQTRTNNGRKVDVGDRFLVRVIDAWRGTDESQFTDGDPGIGLMQALRRANAFPTNAFFAVVSTDFMSRLLVWVTDEKGVTHWGIDAAQAAERAALEVDPANEKHARASGKEYRQLVRERPYYNHSPRLLTLGNLESWPVETRVFANVLLQEFTPNFEPTKTGRAPARKKIRPNKFGGKNMIIRRKGEDFFSCNGSNGRGYTVQHWLTLGGFIKDLKSHRNHVSTFKDFLTAVRSIRKVLSLGLELSLPQKKGETVTGKEAIELLENSAEKPRKLYKSNLKFFLPYDLEERIRELLANAGIEALDEGEEPQVIEEDTDSTKPSIQPQLKKARKKAKMTQTDLASKLKVSQQMIAMWENGKKGLPEEREDELYELLKNYLEDE